MNRLYEAGLITDPRSKAKSVILTEEGAERASELFSSQFGRNPEWRDRIDVFADADTGESSG